MATKKQPTPSAQVLSYLQERPGEIVSPSQISEDTGLTYPQVSAALQHLHRQHRGQLTNRTRGEWVWHEAPTIEVDGEVGADAPTDFVTVSVHSSGGLVLRDNDGGIWLAVPMLPAQQAAR